MAKLRSAKIAKVVVEKLQKNLLHLGHKHSPNSVPKVPKDVKEGHFAVIAVEDDQEERFVIPLRYLRNPSFLTLLEQAAEEYGFDHEGALTIPCPPRKLERMLAEQWAAKNDAVVRLGWDSHETLVESC